MYVLRCRDYITTRYHPSMIVQSTLPMTDNVRCCFFPTCSRLKQADDMRTPASISGHPIHAMLIVFPVGLLIFSLVCDIASLRSADPNTWATVALYTMIGGFIGALAAAIPGLIDLLS